MRRLILLGLCLLLVAAGCARPGPGAGPGATDDPAPSNSGTSTATGGATSSNGTPTAAAGSRDAQIYIAVLRRYLTNPGENSFPGFRFPIVYVLSKADPRAADPFAPPTSTGLDIAVSDQASIVVELRRMGNVQFIGDRAAVIESVDGCEQVRDGGILIVLAPPKGDGDQVEVGMNGFVACLGATWLTYVVRHDPTGWTVTGTTGSGAIA